MSGLTADEEAVLRAKAAQSGMDNAVLYVRHLIAARESDAEQRGAARALRNFGNRVATPTEGQDGPTLYAVWRDAMDAAALAHPSTDPDG